MSRYICAGSPHPAAEYVGRKIVAAEMNDERFLITFEDGKRIAIWDNGQSCCEHRYMRTDDDVQSLVGHKLARIEAKDASSETDEYDVHEVCFVEIGTDAGFITLANHNEHNGYYGGFGLEISEEP